MKKILMTAVLASASTQVMSIPFEPTFSDYAFPGTQFTVDAAANTFFSDNYGIEIDNAYLYRDGRDTFDGIGVSVGEVSEIGSPQVGTITFLDTTDFVSVDYWGIQPTTYTSYGLGGAVLDSFSIGSNTLGTYLFDTGDLISHITWESNGGFGQVTGLRYDYDGTTDGNNDDLDPPTSVPEPTILGMLAMGLVGIGFSQRKRKKVA